MGFRFQRRLKLFPGVRLNFSGSGISTTIGVRGAGFTFGPKGTYVNLGIPGTGLSYRERIAPPLAARPPSPHLQPAQDYSYFENPAPVVGEIKSSSVDTMTSGGLDELKNLINEAAVKHVELAKIVKTNESSLLHAQSRLRLAQLFIVRLFTKRVIPDLVTQIVAAEDALSQTRQQLAGCSIEIDFAFDDITLNAFAALVRSFDALIGCEKVWDITASVATNRFVERTTADNLVTRKLVALSVTSSEIIDTNHKALRITNANGSDIFIYPGFVMLPSTSSDFALVDVRELQVNLSQTRFHEEENVPHDSEVIGQTWKKANKDGSRDRRFANNYQIPIVRYGEIEFRSSTGLWEVYEFSSCSLAFAFGQALIEYQKAVAALAERSKDPSTMARVVPSDEEPESSDMEADVPAKTQGVAQVQYGESFVYDWYVLVISVAALRWAAHLRHVVVMSLAAPFCRRFSKAKIGRWAGSKTGLRYVAYLIPSLPSFKVSSRTPPTGDLREDPWRLATVSRPATLCANITNTQFCNSISAV